MNTGLPITQYNMETNKKKEKPVVKENLRHAHPYGFVTHTRTGLLPTPTRVITHKNNRNMTLKIGKYEDKIDTNNANRTRSTHRNL